jgi:hypothetical protein
MTCKPARDWLLNADAPANWPAAPPEVAEHIQHCAACRALMSDLKNLEALWRNRPLPPRAETSKAAFLERLKTPSMPVSAVPKPRRLAVPRYWAAVTALCLIVGAGLLWFWPAQPVEAHPDVIEQLVDWNLALSEAPSPADRQRIFDNQHQALQKNLEAAQLNPNEQELANDLFANGAWLARNENPAEELQRFNNLADQLLDQVKATTPSDALRANRFAKQFRKVNERGIGRNLERVAASKAADPEVKKLVNRILKHDAERAEQIGGLLERSPDMTKKELRHALDLAHKRLKPKKN